MHRKLRIFYAFPVLFILRQINKQSLNNSQSSRKTESENREKRHLHFSLLFKKSQKVQLEEMTLIFRIHLFIADAVGRIPKCKVYGEYGDYYCTDESSYQSPNKNLNFL